MWPNQEQRRLAKHIEEAEKAEQPQKKKAGQKLEVAC